MSKLYGWILNSWTAVSATLALTGTVDIPTWLVVGPWFLNLVVVILSLLALGLMGVLKADKR